MAKALREAADSAGVTCSSLRGVGVGSPGAVNTRHGTVEQARNLPNWIEPFPLARELGKALGVKVVLGNDVQVATNAEFQLGVGKAYDSLLGVFWGTGVGGGIVLGGKPWVGRGAGGELGHVVVKQGGDKCPCGRRGCLEAYAGRSAMEAKARHAHKKDKKKTKLFEIMEERGRDRLTAGVWARALAQDDKVAHKLVDEAVEALGTGVASAVNLLDVEAVVIGGGLGVKLGDEYAQRILVQMMPHLFVDDRPPAVQVAALGDLGGAVGAALLLPAQPPRRRPAGAAARARR
jgi:glucokinase